MAKKQKCPEFENHERWLVSYADMLTLLFAVFVTLYALKGNDQKSEQAAGSVEESFNKPLEDIPEIHRIGPTEAGFGIFSHLRGNSSHAPMHKKFPEIIKQSPRIIDEEMRKMKVDLEERLYGPNRAIQKLDKTGFERIVSIHREDDGFRVRLLARHFYESGSVQVKRETLKELGAVIESLKKLERPVVIEGHTDSIPPAEMSNWDLSALRATHILKYMINQHNFPELSLSASGYGDTRPIASNTTEEGRALNRRIELKIKYDTKEDPAD
jgi:chemotaxis protein MotB